MVKALRVGFVGAGFIAHFHAKALAQVRNMELAGILNRGGAQELARLASELGIGSPRIYSSIAEMAKNVDAIAVYCPNSLHIEVLEEIALAKKAGAQVRGVICEKPLGRSLAEARRIVGVVKDAGLLTAYFENQIHMKAIQVQKLQLKPLEEKMGPLHLARSAEEHPGPHSSWLWNPTQQGGGALLDMGCHSIAVGWYTLTPFGKPLDFLVPKKISCEIGLLKWGNPRAREQLKQKYGVDFYQNPAEDFATGVVTFQNPETQQLVKAQFTNSWMFEKQGLKVSMDGMGPGYAFEMNTLISPLQIFISDEAGQATADQETALEKSTASRGLLAVQYNEADLYGYVNENLDAATQFLKGENALLSFDYGLRITQLVMAAYLSAERGRSIDLTDPAVQKDLENFVPAVQKGQGRELFHGRV